MAIPFRGVLLFFGFFGGLFGGSPLVEQTLRDLCHPHDIAAADTLPRHLRYDPDRIDKHVELHLCSHTPDMQQRCVAVDKAVEIDAPTCTEGWVENPGAGEPAMGSCGAEPARGAGCGWGSRPWASSGAASAGKLDRQPLQSAAPPSGAKVSPTISSTTPSCARI
jgi:hypothetical protein